MNNHNSNVCRSSYFHIRALRHIRQALTDDMAKTVAASLIHTRIDYTNSLIYGSTNIKKLQRVQTSLARVVLPNLSQQLATALISELHWLPVNFRITFKLACFTYKLLTTGQLAYLCMLLHPYTHSTVD